MNTYFVPSRFSNSNVVAFAVSMGACCATTWWSVSLEKSDRTVMRADTEAEHSRKDSKGAATPEEKRIA